MPVAILLALSGSLLIHGLVLFGAQFDGLPDAEPLTQRLPLSAELRTPPPLPSQMTQRQPEPASQPGPIAVSSVKPAIPVRDADPGLVEAPGEVDALPAPEIAPVLPSTTENATKPEPVAAPPNPSLIHPASGQINFVVVKDSLGMQIGRAVHHWHFAEDGSYVLTSRLETSGLVSLLKPLRQEYESRGRLGPNGLQPESFRVLRNGKDSRENADFDWSTAEVLLTRDGSRQRIAPGTQDLLSLNYQLAYLPRPENGSTLGVVTGRKYERYNLDSLGETEIETPAGRFRTLHLRAAGETLTEIWIALDHQRLPVKIRFTDKKGDSFTQLATDLDLASGAQSLKPTPSGTP